jgi:MFS family permease
VTSRRDRVVLAVAVWAVLVSQVLVYPGVADLVAALGAPGSGGTGAGTGPGPGRGSLDAATVFLVAEFAAFVAFAGAWGAASDALGRRLPLAVAGALGGALVAFVLANGPALGLSWPAVLALRAVGGAATIGAFSLSVTMLADLAGGNGRNLGAAGVAIGLGAALGAVVGGRLADADPLWPLYGTATLLFAAAVLLLAVRDRAPGSGARTSLSAVLAGVRRRPALVVPFAFGLVDRSTAGFFALVGVFYFRETFGLSAAAAGGVLALFFLPFALLQYPLGSLSDRVGRFYPVVVGSVLYGAAIVGVGAAPTLPLAAAGMLLVGVGGALVAPATMALAVDVAAPGERGVALGGFNVFGSLGFLLGVLVGGAAASTLGYGAAFLLVGGAEACVALAAARAVRRLDPVPRGGAAAD